MGDVVFGSFRRVGADKVMDALCEGCQFTWSVLVPEGLRFCKCPMCGGVTEQMKERDEDPEGEWQCECGSITFHISAFRVSCACCGELHAEMIPS